MLFYPISDFLCVYYFSDALAVVSLFTLWPKRRSSMETQVTWSQFYFPINHKKKTVWKIENVCHVLFLEWNVENYK